MKCILLRALSTLSSAALLRRRRQTWKSGHVGMAANRACRCRRRVAFISSPVAEANECLLRFWQTPCTGSGYSTGLTRLWKSWVCSSTAAIRGHPAEIDQLLSLLGANLASEQLRDGRVVQLGRVQDVAPTKCSMRLCVKKTVSPRANTVSASAHGLATKALVSCRFSSALFVRRIQVRKLRAPKTLHATAIISACAAPHRSAARESN